MRALLACLALLLGALVGEIVTAGSASAGCTTVVDDLGEASQVCEYIDKELSEAISQQSTSRWEVYQICGNGSSGGGEVCANPRTCELAGVTGTWYVVRRDGVNVGRACLTATEGTKYGLPSIRELVLKAFKGLDWQPSELAVQPPGGKTLVNLETNFFTTNDSPSDISVTLVGSNVVVTARPIAYLWHFGDGTSVTTDGPGAPYPELDVSHAYKQTDELVVGVDTQYGAASFTVDGGSPEAIPSTIWIAGAGQDLEVVEALPQLVIR